MKEAMQRGPSTPTQNNGPTQGAADHPQWMPRPWAALGVAAVVRGAPILTGAAGGLLTARLLPRPVGVGWMFWLAAIVAASQVCVRVTDRYTRRLLPLSMMLHFSLAFPDQAPSRFAVALRAGNADRLRRTREATAANGLPQDQAEAVASALAMIAELNGHDRGTRGHSERVRAFAEMLAEEMGFDRHYCDRLRWGALLHDMGKITVPPAILNKVGRPTDDEWSVLQRHPAEGERILAPLAEWLGDAVHAAGQHHERWDGGGYPRGLRGEEIAISARIVAVADAFAVMTAARAYKKPLPMSAARQELTRGAGSQFDPAVVRAMLSVSVGRVSRAAGPLSSLSTAPVIGSLLSAAPAIPAMLGSGAAAVALTVGLGTSNSPLAWSPALAPVAAASVNISPDRLAFRPTARVDQGPPTSTTAPGEPLTFAAALPTPTTIPTTTTAAPTTAAPPPLSPPLPSTTPRRTSDAPDRAGGATAVTGPDVDEPTTSVGAPVTPTAGSTTVAPGTTSAPSSPTTTVAVSSDTKPARVTTTTTTDDPPPTTTSPSSETTPPATVPPDTKAPKATTTTAATADTTPPIIATTTTETPKKT